MSTSSGPRLVAVPSSSEDPSKGDDSSGQGSGRKPGPGSRGKRTLIESACIACQKRKSRCDGERPACTRCQSLRTECIYKAEQGETRWKALRRQNETLEQERDDLNQVLSFLIRAPEAEAREVFYRMRSLGYERLPSIAQQIRERAPGVATATGPSLSEQTLPPIRSLELPGAQHLPSRPGLSPSAPSEESIESYSSSYSGFEPPPPPSNT